MIILLSTAMQFWCPFIEGRKVAKGIWKANTSGILLEILAKFKGFFGPAKKSLKQSILPVPKSNGREDEVYLLLRMSCSRIRANRHPLLQRRFCAIIRKRNERGNHENC